MLQFATKLYVNKVTPNPAHMTNAFQYPKHYWSIDCEFEGNRLISGPFRDLEINPDQKDLRLTCRK